jgi:hypothetical protein
MGMLDDIGGHFGYGQRELVAPALLQGAYVRKRQPAVGQRRVDDIHPIDSGRHPQIEYPVEDVLLRRIH